MNIISIDFSEKVPFRLKLPMVKAAIEVGLYLHTLKKNKKNPLLLLNITFIMLVSFGAQRGVCFEIAYTDLILDLQARRQMISNAKVCIIFLCLICVFLIKFI